MSRGLGEGKPSLGESLALGKEERKREYGMDLDEGEKILLSLRSREGLRRIEGTGVEGVQEG